MKREVEAKMKEQERDEASELVGGEGDEDLDPLERQRLNQLGAYKK